MDLDLCRAIADIKKQVGDHASLELLHLDLADFRWEVGTAGLQTEQSLTSLSGSVASCANLLCQWMQL